MALADYRLCDVCGRKAFYDANLNYVWDRQTGKLHLDYLGDWAVICADCEEEYETVVVRKPTIEYWGA